MFAPTTLARVFALLAVLPSCFNTAVAVRKPPDHTAEDKPWYSPESPRPIPLPGWYYTPDLTLTNEEWTDFTTKALSTNMLENPVWYLFHCGYLLREFSRQQERLATLLALMTKNRQWGRFRTEYFKIIAPLTTEWYPLDAEEVQDGEAQVPCTVFGVEVANAYKENTRYHPSVDVPPGIMDCGGPLDTSAERDNPRAQSDGNAFPRDYISVHKIIRGLFSAQGQEDEEGRWQVFASQTGFLKAWLITHQTIERMAPFVEGVFEYIEAIPPDLSRLPDEMPLVDERPRQTRLFPREKIGYQAYYDDKFGGSFMATEDLVADPEWLDEAVTAYIGREAGAPDVFVLYGVIVNTVFREILPLMMDMFADIAVKANDVARSHVQLLSGIDASGLKKNPLLTWAIPESEEFEVSEDILRLWPEWTEDVYVVDPWPVPESELQDAVNRMAVEKLLEQELHAESKTAAAPRIRTPAEPRSSLPTGAFLRSTVARTERAMMLRQRDANQGGDAGVTTTASWTTAPSATSTSNDANRVAHVTSAVIGCILGAALAGAIFALGLALYRFHRRQRLRKRLLDRITTQIAQEHSNDETPLDEEARQTLVAERFYIVAERYWRQQRRVHARNGRRPARRRDDLRDMAGDLYRERTRGTGPREPETAYVRFGGTSYVPMYATLLPGMDNERRGG
ncbi:hypothetical protein Dda_1056 [Drechslerella dactyloides]|uniref:Uncharacterized protein n=1 Tax=Drechslerella dactyloides TaxID=74499 RepID=A0AAD6J5I0_DREDA|nr:hypothetical protein Dda_1056 [Drechslerella dactyloides]